MAALFLMRCPGDLFSNTMTTIISILSDRIFDCSSPSTPAISVTTTSQMDSEPASVPDMEIEPTGNNGTTLPEFQQAAPPQDDNNNQDDIPEIELIIKASTIDGRRKGACLFGQEYFMDLYLLAELKTISLKVTTVDMLKPPPDFRSKFDSTPPPILIDRGEPVLENEKIERYIMKNIPGGHNLFVSDKETLSVIENIYTKFKVMLTKNDDHSKQAFENQLKKIDQHLAKRKTRYLTGDTLCCFDCELMTRLQHIRVAGKYFTGFEISESFIYLWRYMYHMYNLDAFKQSCPADQDIINHYKQKQGATKQLTKHEELEAPTYSRSIPQSVLDAFGDQL
ncbi:Chloride intracellular channel, variant 3 [Dermatophagoides farinae]|uniref:Chloride intracellular channel, variant 3 n=1 Tax=Dermatophagoides farinae TaxID=6954 RepID=A0A922I1F4_DERFA|nr:hypothetical protein HUG17_0370 [Dermatophagoides farinae]KAH9520489.1 Chloride intracellular channel, variant 3 [Dermatophagoides farinae]